MVDGRDDINLGSIVMLADLASENIFVVEDVLTEIAGPKDLY